MAVTTKRRKKKTIRRAKTGIGAIKPQGFAVFCRFVHQEVDSKEYVNIVKGYVKKAFNKNQAETVLANPDYTFSSSSLAAWCYWTSVYSDQPFAEGDFGPCAGAKNDEDQYNQATIYHNKKLEELIESGKSLVSAKKAKDKAEQKVYKPSIQ